MQTFEYDPAKSQANAIKHGIDFVEAQAIWRDDNALEALVQTAGETRWIMVGRINNKLWSAVFTRRGESVRLISCRRSRRKEEQFYENQRI